MADGKTDVGAQDRSGMAGEERYELDYFARENGLTKKQARSLIDRLGDSRAALHAAADAPKSKR